MGLFKNFYLFVSDFFRNWDGLFISLSREFLGEGKGGGIGNGESTGEWVERVGMLGSCFIFFFYFFFCPFTFYFTLFFVTFFLLIGWKFSWLLLLVSLGIVF